MKTKLLHICLNFIYQADALIKRKLQVSAFLCLFQGHFNNQSEEAGN